MGDGRLSARLTRPTLQEPCCLQAGSIFETPLNVPALNSNESPKLILRAAVEVKAAALEAGSRLARCLIIVEVSACYHWVQHAVCGPPQCQSVICRQCHPVSSVLVQQHLSKHVSGKNLKATSCVICGMLEKDPLPLSSGCTHPGRILCSGSVPAASCLPSSWGSSSSCPSPGKDGNSSL